MIDTSAVFGLRELLGSMPIDTFLENHWRKNKAIVIHDTLDRLCASEALSELLVLEDFARKYYGRVSMIHPDGRAIDVQSGEQALPYLSQGFTIYFRHIEQLFPKLKPILAQIAADTGMPASEFTAEIFTSSGESGVPMHCDYDYNLSLLLAGNKTWSFAENKGILNQTSIFMPRGREQIEPSQLAYRTKAPHLDSMPQSTVSEALVPGSLIFMPRGWWHTTHSTGTCVCVNFVMKGPHWARLFTHALEKELLPNPLWRAYPYDVARTDGGEEQALHDLSRLIDSLKQGLFSKPSNDIAHQIVRKYLEH